MAQTATSEAWDRSPTLADLIQAMDQAILDGTARNATPAMRLAFDGALGVDDLQRIHDQLHGIEIIAPHPRSPVEFLAYQAKDKLAEWEVRTTERFRLDFDLAHRPSAGVVNYDRLALHDTALAREHRAAGYAGKGAARTYSSGDVSDARIGAMQRRGAFLAASRTSFWFLEAIVGFELWPKDLAPHLGWDVRRVGYRFREAVADAAGFYRMHAKGPERSRVRVWNAP